MDSFFQYVVILVIISVLIDVLVFKTFRTRLWDLLRGRKVVDGRIRRPAKRRNLRRPKVPSQAWKDRGQVAPQIAYLSPTAAVAGTVVGHPVRLGYRLASLYFGTGLIDRSGMLDVGFPYDVRDPIPTPTPGGPSLPDLCDARAVEIITEARRWDCPIRVLWSGGIDSTAAAVALLRHLAPGERDQLQFLYTAQSINEYPRFFRDHIKPLPGARKKFRQLHRLQLDDGLIVTGEHGDQLFGSSKAIGIPTGDLGRPWRDAWRPVLVRALGSPERADAVVATLAPQFERVPVPLSTLFDLFWWINFSLKWQSVEMRIPAAMAVPNAMTARRSFVHFFGTTAFQNWSLTHPDSRAFAPWHTYKRPLRAYIRAFTGDDDYYENKLKQPSLRDSIAGVFGGYGIVVDTDGQRWRQPFDDHLRYTDGISPSIILSSETDLWDAVDCSGE